MNNEQILLQDFMKYTQNEQKNLFNLREKNKCH